jgi:hypothetical protein
MILDVLKLLKQKIPRITSWDFFIDFPKINSLKQHNYPFPETSLLSTLSIVFFQSKKKQ